MKGARALASGMLVLALSCAVPALSAAQDAGTTTDATTTTAPPTPPAPPPAAPADTPDQHPEPAPPEAPPTGPAAGTPSEAVGSTGETSTQLGRGSPADGPGGGARKAASAAVTMGDLFFSPSSVTVAVGDTVTWHNTGQAPHNATADDGSFKTPTLNNGQSASHTFTQAGTFSYICTIHPNMKGTVRVLSSSTGGGGAGNASSSSSGSAGSEASAVGSPNAAGDANTLPMTGMAAGALALVGLAMLGCGLLVRFWGRRASGSERQLTLF